MKNHKWGTQSFTSEPIYVVLFVSRNKDNRQLDGFKERRMSFITHHQFDDEKLIQKFDHFVEDGISGELSRMYCSVNARNGVKIYKQLMHFLFDNPDFNLCDLAPKLAGIAAMKECAAEKKFMFDFDCGDPEKLMEFMRDISQYSGEEFNDIVDYCHITPHGHAVVTKHGFDTRKLLEKWKDIVELKRDDMLCVCWRNKNVD